MYDVWASSNVDTQKWRSDFNWSTFEDRVFQASYWTKAEVRLGKDQSLKLDIKDGVDTTGHFPLSTDFNYTVNAPSVSASSVQQMSTMEARSNDVVVVSSKEMKQNPEAYGWTQRRANQLAKGEDVYIYAPK
jgi:hypothetical protein